MKTRGREAGRAEAYRMGILGPPAISMETAEASWMMSAQESSGKSFLKRLR